VEKTYFFSPSLLSIYLSNITPFPKESVTPLNATARIGNCTILQILLDHMMHLCRYIPEKQVKK